MPRIVKPPIQRVMVKRSLNRTLVKPPISRVIVRPSRK